MTKNMRFGRRLSLPSTRQIKHELIVLMREDLRRELAKAKEEASGSSAGHDASPATN